jgi:predicted nucleotidyltransferase
MTGPLGDEPADPDVDLDRVVRVLEEYPIRCAVLFGSYARGTQTTDSDVDIAVGFEDELSPSERLDRRIELTTDLMETLGTNAVDVADLDSIRPAVGADALRTGTRLVGDRDVVDEYLDRFDRETEDETHEERMQRFDAILERLEGQV